MRYGIALGSNVGDRLGHLSKARRLLLALSDAPDTALFSPVFESAPVDCATGTAAFLNAVAELSLPFPPAELLLRCQQIERDFGRAESRLPNSPRQLDLDILYAGELVIDSADLIVPHPRLTQRRFVLQPLAAIRPDLRLPGFDQSVSQLQNSLDSDEPPLQLVADEW